MAGAAPGARTARRRELLLLSRAAIVTCFRGGEIVGLGADRAQRPRSPRLLPPSRSHARSRRPLAHAGRGALRRARGRLATGRLPYQTWNFALEIRAGAPLHRRLEARAVRPDGG